MSYVIIYEDGHRGEARSYESVLEILRNGRRHWWCRHNPLMIPVRVIEGSS